jgi:ubiquinone/menaquinone biosynthesis C-methylase UbiE
MNCYFCKNKLENNNKIITTSSGMRWNCYGYNKAIVKCKSCNLIQLLPQWNEEQLKEIYSRYSSKQDFKGHKIKEHKTPEYLKDYINKNDIILEVGCGFGNNVFQLKKSGYKVYGFDKDPSVCDEKTIFNLDCSILGTKEYNNTFDIIYGIHLFEHLNNPLEFIENCYRALKNEGKLILEFPNMEEPLLTLYKNKAFFKFFWLPDHSFFYIPKTIKNLITCSLFKTYKVCRLQRYGIFNHLNWLFKNKPTNINFNIPFIDLLYKFIIVKLLKRSDTILVILEKG